MGIPRVILTQRKFVDILDEIIIPIYTYGNRDFTVLNNLLVLFYRLSLAIDEDQISILEVYIELVMKEADQNLKDKRARSYLNKTLNKLSATGKFNVQSLQLL